MPIRDDRKTASRVIRLPLRLLWALLKPLARPALRFVLKHPQLRFWLSAQLQRSPRLFATLKRFALERGLLDITSPLQNLAGRPDGGPWGKRIALVAPVSAKGVTGGAERFYAGLEKALRDKGFVVDLVTLPFDESSFEKIQETYQAFANLDLHGYDLVISTKVPSYMVQHPNHLLYLVHTVRVFYDMYDELLQQSPVGLVEKRDWIRRTDTKAFLGIRRRFAIGVEVADRLKRWNGCTAEVLHPPIDVAGLHNQGLGDYFFLPGRLHRWKRVSLAIEAVRESPLPMRLLIAGTGAEEQALRALAQDDARIQLLGFVDDSQLKDLYANALAVPFLPIHEDYGYVTIEAFAAAKPVITCTDSGETLQFVEHNVTGLVCEPTPASVRHAMERLWQDRELARRMGRAGQERTAHISWPRVAETLLRSGFGSASAARPRLRVAVLDMQPITPAVGGGRLRLLGLYHALGDDIEARYVGSYDWPGDCYRRHFASPTLEEITVPLSPAHHAAAAEAAAQAGGKVVIDLLFGRQGHLSPEYLAEAVRAVTWADVVVFSHPWVAPLIEDDLLVGKTVVYDSHNVERSLRAQLLDLDNPFERDLLARVEAAERRAGDRADLILACSDEDAGEFVRLYAWPRSKMAIVPNGVFTSSLQPATAAQKRQARKSLKIAADSQVAFFIGSNYSPNVEAANVIIDELAPQLPDLLFVIGGSVSARIPGGKHNNVRIAGFLEETQKREWLHAADFALNPMCSGSGTNIKMFDFMAAGLPIITTPVGARGIAADSTAGICIAERAHLTEAIREQLVPGAARQAAGAENRALVERDFSWETLSPGLGRLLHNRHWRKCGEALLRGQGSGAPRIAHLTTLGHKCGIGEYTRKIIEVFSAANIANLVLTCRTVADPPRIDDCGAEAHLAWFYDNEKWLDSRIDATAFERLSSWHATGVMIQYHPAFYPAEILLGFVKDCLDRGLPSIVVVHKYPEYAATVFAELNALGVAVFSHGRSEIATARRQGVTLDRVPLGVDVVEPLPLRETATRDWAKEPPRLVTNGFLRKHKGVCSLLRALPLVHAQFPGAQLKIQCALYPSQDSAEELAACQALIKSLALADHVVLDTRYLGKPEILAEMAKADLAVLPYDSSSEGGSASATDALAVGLPLIVSPAEIFDDLRETVITAPAVPEQLAEAIIALLSDPERYQEFAGRSSAYAGENAWRQVAGIFLAAL